MAKLFHCYKVSATKSTLFMLPERKELKKIECITAMTTGVGQLSQFLQMYLYWWKQSFKPLGWTFAWQQLSDILLGDVLSRR